MSYSRRDSNPQPTVPETAASANWATGACPPRDSNAQLPDFESGPSADWGRRARVRPGGNISTARPNRGGGGIRTHDLRVMSPPRCLTALHRVVPGQARKYRRVFGDIAYPAGVEPAGAGFGDRSATTGSDIRGVIVSVMFLSSQTRQSNYSRSISRKDSRCERDSWSGTDHRVGVAVPGCVSVTTTGTISSSSGRNSPLSGLILLTVATR